MRKCKDLVKVCIIPSSRGAQRRGDPSMQAWQAKTGCFAGLAMTGMDFCRASYANFFNYALFFFFLIVWSLYGIVYKMDLKTKNITYNYLDLVSKCFVGIGLWLYFTNMFKL